MGDSSKSMKKKHVAIDMIAGSASGAISRTLTAPLDLIKIRFQVQLEPTTSSALLHKKFYGPSKYYGLLQATKDIFKEEGLPGFWRGNVPALLLYMEYAAIQFTVLRQIKTFMSGSSNKEDHKKLSPYVSFMSGALGGSAATIGSYPFDLLRTILAFQGEPKVYPNMRSAIVGVYRARGLQGLYAGLLPTLINIVPYSGCQFGFYDLFKHWIMAWKQLKQGKEEIFDDNISGIQLFMCGTAASTSAKVVCHPLDVVKKRLQVIGLERHPKYGARVEYDAFRNATRAVSQIMKKEGWAGLYKGMVPSVIKAAPAGAVTFFTYELFSKWLESVFV